MGLVAMLIGRFLPIHLILASAVCGACLGGEPDGCAAAAVGGAGAGRRGPAAAAVPAAEDEEGGLPLDLEGDEGDCSVEAMRVELLQSSHRFRSLRKVAAEGLEIEQLSVGVPPAPNGGSDNKNAIEVNGTLSAVHGAAMPALADVGGRLVRVPFWCKYVPWAQKAEECQGPGGGCNCSSWCDNIPNWTWSALPGCCDCSNETSPDDIGEVEVAADTALPSFIDVGGTLVKVPSWCQYVPWAYKAEACQGPGGGCNCSSWCENIPNWTWGPIPGCCDCSNGTLPVDESELAVAVDTMHGMGLAIHGAAMPSSVDIGGDLVRLPFWCKYVPWGYKAEACSGIGCNCSAWCDNIPKWTWSPLQECCGCGNETDPADATELEMDATKVLSSAPPLAAPSWCAYLPSKDSGSFQLACTCECKSYCEDEVPNETWPVVPTCCGCPGAAKHLGKTLGPHLYPEWCRYIPDDYLGESCEDCECKDYCQDVAMGHWMMMVDCCLCPYTSDSTRTNSSSGTPSPSPQKVTPRAGSALTPSWCKYVPLQHQTEACGMGCECKDFCTKAPEWTWDPSPECCGCSKGRLLQESPGARGAEVAPGGGSNLTLPTWCQWTPEKLREGLCGSSCQCRRWCRWVPSAVWDEVPGCCTCNATLLGLEDGGTAAEGEELLPPPVAGAAADGGGAGLEIEGSGAAQYPDWCRYVADDYKGRVCGRCSCEGFCAEVPQRSWPSSAQCCLCSSEAPPEEAAAA